MKFTKSNLDGICKVLGFIHDKETVQHILNVIGRENWTREVFNECSYSNLTHEQAVLFDQMGGNYTYEEIEQMMYIDDINEEISDRLREQGVTPFLYQNEDYLNAIREGKVICEGIDVQNITNEYFQINEEFNEPQRIIKKVSNMELTKQDLDGICKVLGFIHDKETVQHILNVIGREYWNRDIMGHCDYELLTDEQKMLYDSLGCLISDEEMDEVIDNLIINSEIKEQLKQQGVTPYLYENVDYLNSIREGKVICEGIDIEKIKEQLYYEG